MNIITYNVRGLGMGLECSGSSLTGGGLVK